jgi:sugar phosphate isomerase/epimerase
MHRRDFLMSALAAAAAGASTTAAQAVDFEGAGRLQAGSRPPPRIVFTIFSRHLQWLTTQAYAMSNPYETGVLVGQKAQELGYTAVDLTVRSTGHVDPNLVDVKTNLPAMLKGLRSTGATCAHITTNVVDDRAAVATYLGNPVYASDVLNVAAAEGIRIYRWGGFSYSTQPDPATGAPQPFGMQVLEQLEAFTQRVQQLAYLNRRLGLTAVYHTFSGGNNGRSVWDLMHMLQHFNPDDLALNFDIGHMITESALSAWRTNVRYAMPYIRSAGLKDALVERNPSSGTVRSVWKLAGTGMVQWREFFTLLLQGGFSGPAEAQYEYDVVGLRGTNVSLNTTFWADHAQFVSGNLTPAFMTAELAKDLVTYRAQAAAAGWASNQVV